MQALVLDNKEYVILDKAEYLELVSAKDDEVFPQEFVDKLFDEGSRLRVWREYRGLTMRALADATGVSQSYISEIESSKKDGSIKVLKRIASVLKADLDLLV